MLLKRLILVKVYVLFVSQIYAQSFSENSASHIKGSSLGFSSIVDYNNDKLLDIFITGHNLSQEGDFDHAILYKNNGDGTFSDSGIENIKRAIYGDSDWGDFNNDGHPDLIYSGTLGGSSEENFTRVYKNNGNGTFTELSLDLHQIQASSVKWIDFDNDGDQDLFLMGISSFNNHVTRLYENVGNEKFVATTALSSSITGGRGNFNSNSSVWCDFNNDGYKDVVLGQSSGKEYKILFYANNGNKTFKQVSPSLNNTNYSSIAASDIDNDGLIDLIISGSNNLANYSHLEEGTLVVYRNSGNFNFSEVWRGHGIFWGKIAAGDLDNDGLSDILLSGGSNQGVKTFIYKNMGEGKFSSRDLGATGIRLGSISLADFDNNGSLDFLVHGSITGSASEAISKIYINSTTSKNNRPKAPTNLRTELDEDKITFRWDKTTDPETDANGLTYNINIGIENNKDAHSSNLSDAEGYRKIEAFGNTDGNNFFILSRKITGKLIWSVQAIDNAYYESLPPNSQTFCYSAKPTIEESFTFCRDSPITIEAEGTDIRWYNDQLKSDLLGVGNKISISKPFNHNIFVTQTLETCESEVVAIELKEISEDVNFYIDNSALPVNESTIEISLCDDEEKHFLSTDPIFQSYFWHPLGEHTNRIELSTSGEYVLSVVDDNGCSFSKSIKIIVRNLNFQIPNVFTPNGDGKNDFFEIKGMVNNTNIEIFNRWGNLIYSNENYKNDWHGEKEKSGIYFYNISNNSYGCLKKYKGWVQVLK